MKQVASRAVLGLFFIFEDGGEMFLRNVTSIFRVKE
jgi:hypothetical protein